MRRALLAAIDTGPLIGLRGWALIGTMVYTFARVNAVLARRVNDYFIQGRRGWMRLYVKGGKEHEVPCHHTLERLLASISPPLATRVAPFFVPLAVRPVV